jgi:hypothetical protein
VNIMMRLALFQILIPTASITLFAVLNDYQMAAAWYLRGGGTIINSLAVDLVLVNMGVDYFRIDVWFFRKVLAPRAKTQRRMNALYKRDADIYLSFRLQQLTSLRADPDGRVLRLTEPELHDYPFLYLTHPGYSILSDAEVANLRKYLLAGGVIAIIDFWNSIEWNGLAAQMRRILPERSWTDLSIEHPLFHCVYDLKGPLQALQVPTMQFWNRARNPDDPSAPLQIERGPDSEKLAVRALLDDRGRIMVIAFHNSDLSDGWEREGENADYFATFSEKISYPLGINLVFYLMTH